MTRKILLAVFSTLVLGASGVSCSEEISDCPNKLCVMAGGWKLTEVQVDGELFTENYSDYRLILSDPSPSAEVTSQFQRVNIGGATDTGTWSVENTNPDLASSFKGSILRLRPSGDAVLREDWEIESFTPRRMVLVLRRDITVKDGPATIRFVLTPF